MTEKMTYERAKETIVTWENSPAFLMSGSKEHAYWRSKGFIECYESRDSEVAELKKKNENLIRGIDEINRENTNHLKRISELKKSKCPFNFNGERVWSI